MTYARSLAFWTCCLKMGFEMKSLLFAFPILAICAPSAMAEIQLTGDARLGIIDSFGIVGPKFTSRVRVKFKLFGETDGGLTFGASTRADLAEQANVGTAGTVFIAGSFGMLSMGDVEGAAERAIGHVSGVGMTGIPISRFRTEYEPNKSAFIAVTNTFNGTRGGPSVLYQIATGPTTFYASTTNPSAENHAYAFAASYDQQNYRFAVGYEDIEQINFGHFTQVIVGATVNLGEMRVKANFGKLRSATRGSAMQHEISLDYTVGALTVTAFASERGKLYDAIPPAFSFQGYGIGAFFDLGNGATLAGGYVVDRTRNEHAFDLGVQMRF